MYFNEEIETLPRQALEALQLKRLQGMLERIYANVPFTVILSKHGSFPAITSLMICTPSLYPEVDMRDSYPMGSSPRRWKISSVSMPYPAPLGTNRRHTKDISTRTELISISRGRGP
jgi:phenylacetate-CoA ligase